MEALDKFTTVWYTFSPLLRITVSMMFSNKSFMCLQLIVVINNQKTEFERHFWLSLSQKLNAKSLYIKAKHKSIALCRLLTFSQFALKDKLRNPCPGYPNDERSACDLIIRQKIFRNQRRKSNTSCFVTFVNIFTGQISSLLSARPWIITQLVKEVGVF